MPFMKVNSPFLLEPHLRLAGKAQSQIARQEKDGSKSTQEPDILTNTESTDVVCRHHLAALLISSLSVYTLLLLDTTHRSIASPTRPCLLPTTGPRITPHFPPLKLILRQRRKCIIDRADPLEPYKPGRRGRLERPAKQEEYDIDERRDNVRNLDRRAHGANSETEADGDDELEEVDA